MLSLLVFSATGAWLLLAAGVMKVRRPQGTVQAISVLTGLGDGIWRPRLLGLAEIAIALGFLGWPSALSAVGLGLAYLLVLASAWILRARGSDCGCFGDASSHVGPAHLWVSGVVAVSALAVAITGNSIPMAGDYAVVVSSIPAALGSYALVVPLTNLRATLDNVRP